MDTQSVTCSFATTDLEAVDEIAQDLNLDRTTILQNAVAMYIADHLETLADLEEGERDIREGRTISHEEVEARFLARCAAEAV